MLSSEVLPSHLADLQKGRVEPQRVGAARAYVANLVQEAARAARDGHGPPRRAVPSTTLP